MAFRQDIFVGPLKKTPGAPDVFGLATSRRGSNMSERYNRKKLNLFDEFHLDHDPEREKGIER